MSVKCPYCGEEMEPDKRVSMAGAVFLNTFYCLYYYWFKDRHCPACNHVLAKDDLQNYLDPDNTWKWLSAVQVIVSLLVIMVSIMIVFSYLY